jgi:hypothetical protein
MLLRLVGQSLAARERSAGDSARPESTTSGPRILLIRPDHLGDVLLAGPAGRLLTTALPSARIDWLVGPLGGRGRPTLGPRRRRADVRLPRLHSPPKGSAWAPYATLLAEARRLRAREYDVALVLRPDHWWGGLLAATAGIPERIGYAAPECRPFLTHSLSPPDGVHAVEANLALAHQAARAYWMHAARPAPHLRSGEYRPRFSVTAAERAWGH